MANVPKRVSERLISELGKFQKVLQAAKDRDVNEADTVTIVKDILSALFGYDKYAEVTSEYSIRSTFCDLAVRVDGKVKFLIEVKAIGLDLKGNHLKQAVDYGANQGIDWVVLTNGQRWCIHKIKFERPINNQLVCEMNLLEMSARNLAHQELLFLLCREGLAKAAIEEFHQYQLIVNRFTFGALVLTDPVLDVMRRELRRVSPEARVDNAEISEILQTQVLKREVLESDEGQQARAMLKRAASRALRRTRETGYAPENAAAESEAEVDNGAQIEGASPAITAND